MLITFKKGNAGMEDGRTRRDDMMRCGGIVNTEDKSGTPFYRRHGLQINSNQSTLSMHNNLLHNVDELIRIKKKIIN